MPPIPKDFSAWKDQVTTWVEEGVTQPDICQMIQEAGMPISLSKLRLLLRDWNIRKHRAPVDSPELREKLSYHFHELRLTDKESKAALQDEGIEIGMRTLQRLRKQLGLMKRVPMDKSEEQFDRIAGLLRQELDDGRVGKQNREALYAYMRSKYNIVGRDRVYLINRLLNPEAAERRVRRNREPRSRATVSICAKPSYPVPNFAHMADGTH